MGKRISKMTDSELINYIKNRAKELKRTPTTKQIKYYSIILNQFGTWNNALSLAGLRVNRWHELSREESLKIINTYYDKHKSIPGLTNWNKIKELPRVEVLMKPFEADNWVNFILSLGLPHPLTRYKGTGENYSFAKYTDKQLLGIIRKEVDRLDFTLATDYKSKKTIDMPSYDYLAARFKAKSWNDLLVLMGLGDKVLYIKYTKEQLIDILKEIGVKKEAQPTARDVEALNMASSTFISHFGSWNEALIAAGFQPLYKIETTHTKEELIEKYIDLCDKLDRVPTGLEIYAETGIKENVDSIRFDGFVNLAKLAGYEHPRGSKLKYSKKDVGDLILEQVDLKGSKLTTGELKGLLSDSFPSYTTILRRFQTTKISDVWKELGL